jgi:hypothetical protein
LPRDRRICRNCAEQLAIRTIQSAFGCQPKTWVR